MEIEIVVATRNAGKLGEIEAALAEWRVRLYTLLDYPDAPEVVEDRDTFAGNAEKKARAIALHTGKYALADDSGLAVDALGGAPGVYSARYAGEPASDAANNRKLLAELDRRGSVPRTARFVCVMALASPAGRVTLAEGRVEGEILTEPRGAGGFGYDPLFYYPPFQATFAEISRERKLEVSHRGRALRELAARLPAMFESGEGHGRG